MIDIVDRQDTSRFTNNLTAAMPELKIGWQKSRRPIMDMENVCVNFFVDTQLKEFKLCFNILKFFDRFSKAFSSFVSKVITPSNIIIFMLFLRYIVYKFKNSYDKFRFS